MTINDAITRFRNLKPNQYDDAMLVSWLSDLDGLLYNEYAKWHEGLSDLAHGPYDPDGGMDETLLVSEPYSDIYIKYMSAQVDYHNSETARYNNSMVMYNMALMAYADWINRNNLPLQANYIRF